MVRVKFFIICILYLSLILIVFSVRSCATMGDHPGEEHFVALDSLVYAVSETVPLAEDSLSPAGGDLVLWIHPLDPERSLLIGTNNSGALSVYDLAGNELYYYPMGEMHHVDLRYDFPLGKEKVDIIVAYNKTYNTLSIFTIDQNTGELTSVEEDTVRPRMKEIAGICMYVNMKKERYYTFISGHNGSIEKWELIPHNGKVRAKKVNAFDIEGQAGVMVADDELGFIYIAQKDRGIWKYKADEEGAQDPRRVVLNEQGITNLTFNVRGLAIYYAPEGKGYLMASGWEDNSCFIFKREGRNEYITRFFVARGKFDGIEEPDGIDVTQVSLGELFPTGLFIAYDKYNYGEDTIYPQNFKLVPWEDISALTEPSLLISPGYSVR